MKTLTYNLLLIIAMTMVACKKEKLTKETQVGANTFSCKINGKVYKAKSELLSKGLIGGVTMDKNGIKTFSIGSVMYHNEDSDYAVFLEISDFVGIKTYDLREETGYVDKVTSPITDYKSRPHGYGSLNVKYWDMGKRIIAGTFEFVAVDIQNPNNIIKITDGRFDLKY